MTVLPFCYFVETAFEDQHSAPDAGRCTAAKAQTPSGPGSHQFTLLTLGFGHFCPAELRLVDPLKECTRGLEVCFTREVTEPEGVARTGAPAGMRPVPSMGLTPMPNSWRILPSA